MRSVHCGSSTDGLQKGTFYTHVIVATSMELMAVGRGWSDTVLWGTLLQGVWSTC